MTTVSMPSTAKLHYIEPQGTSVNDSIYPRFKISNVQFICIDYSWAIYNCSIKPEV